MIIDLLIYNNYNYDGAISLFKLIGHFLNFYDACKDTSRQTKTLVEL